MNNLILSSSLEANEIAEVILRDCGTEKSQSIATHLQNAIEDKMRSELKLNTCRKCGEEVKQLDLSKGEQSLCGKCA